MSTVPVTPPPAEASGAPLRVPVHSYLEARLLTSPPKAPGASVRLLDTEVHWTERPAPACHVTGGTSEPHVFALTSDPDSVCQCGGYRLDLRTASVLRNA